jgi:Ca2+-transporting ATPase
MAPHPRISPLHVCIKGRARFKIRGLRGRAVVKEKLETHLASFSDVYHVSASTLTGNLLILYHPARSHADAADWIEDILQDDAPQSALRPEKNGEGALDAAMEATEIEADAAPLVAWHDMAEHEVLLELEVSGEHGLTTPIADQRQQRFGPNALPLPRGRSRGQLFFEQLHALPLILLATEGALALVTGAAVEAAVVAGMVAINAMIGYAVELQTQRTLIAVKHKPRPTAEVIRDGRSIEIPGEALVPGDVLVLTPGTYIGADSRIILATHLKIDESLLTGESIPVDKQSQALSGGRTSLFERRNMAFMGTLVVGGQGLAVVVATGQRTEYGRMQHLIAETFPPKTLMTEKLHTLSRQLLHVGAWICAGAFGLGWIRGLRPIEALRASLSMATTIIPAGLPSTATANLALGIHRLAKQQVAVHKLYAVETLGAVRIICFDKTGTITRSRISVLRLYVGHQRVKIRNRRFIAGETTIDPLQSAALRQMIEACVLCNESKMERREDSPHRLRLKGSPTEKALLFMGFLAKADIFGIYQSHSLKQVVHRGEFRRRMITVHGTEDGHDVVSVKGDPLEVLRMCNRQLVDTGPVALAETDKADIENENDDMAADGLRVLGLAYKIGHREDPQEAEQDFIWIGLVAMAEPIRQGVEPLMAELHQAGIETVMITGDQNLTATAVASRIGLAGGLRLNSLDSSRFDTLAPDLLKALIQDVQVFSRVNPSQKLQIVRAYQKAGHTVAMTGDGINDGPALRAADIGIAMGLTGTDVAREVADVILTDDNLANLGRAVAGGRSAHYNLKKSIGYFLTSNFSEAAFSLAALTAGIARQPVGLNILPDILPGLALLTEPAHRQMLATPPIDLHGPIFNGSEIRTMAKSSAIIAAGAMGAYGLGALRHGGGVRAVTMATETLTAARILHALNCRNSAGAIQGPTVSPWRGWMGLALASSLALQVTTLLTPGLRRLSGAARLDLADLAITAAAAGATYLLSAPREKPLSGLSGA